MKTEELIRERLKSRYDMLKSSYTSGIINILSNINTKIHIYNPINLY